jgi:hypothetical protein
MERTAYDKNDNSVKPYSRFDFVDAQIAMVRGRANETERGFDHNDACTKLRHLLIIRLGMSVGTDTTVESAVTQVLNWKDGER